MPRLQRPQSGTAPVCGENNPNPFTGVLRSERSTSSTAIGLIGCRVANHQSRTQAPITPCLLTRYFGLRAFSTRWGRHEPPASAISQIDGRVVIPWVRSFVIPLLYY